MHKYVKVLLKRGKRWGNIQQILSTVFQIFKISDVNQQNENYLEYFFSNNQGWGICDGQVGEVVGCKRERGVGVGLQ